MRFVPHPPSLCTRLLQLITSHGPSTGISISQTLGEEMHSSVVEKKKNKEEEKKIFVLTKINGGDAQQGTAHEETLVKLTGLQLVLNSPPLLTRIVIFTPDKCLKQLGLFQQKKEKKRKRNQQPIPPQPMRELSGSEVPLLIAVWRPWDFHAHLSHSCFPVTLLDSRSVQGELGWVANPTEGGVSRLLRRSVPLLGRTIPY